MTTLKKLAYRLRLKLKDTDSKTYSKYEVLDSINESIRELRRIVTQFHSQLSFPVPNTRELTEASPTGWPDEFNELIIEYTLILLSSGDYSSKEQAKMLWQQKVLSQASSMDESVNLIHGCYETKAHRHIHLIRKEPNREAHEKRNQRLPEHLPKDLLPDNDGSIQTYKYWAKTASESIIDVAVYTASPGIVNIFPLLTNGEIPGQDILKTVYAICNDDKVKLLTDEVQVGAPTQTAYSIDVSYWIDKDREEDEGIIVCSDVEAAINDYILWQKSALDRNIDPSQLIFMMKKAGAKRVAVTLPVYQALEITQVAKEQAVTIQCGGTE